MSRARFSGPKRGSETLTLTRSVAVQLAAADGPRVPRFEAEIYNGGPVYPYWPSYGDRPAIIDIAGLSFDNPTPVLMDHDPEDIVGQAEVLQRGRATLTASGIITGTADPESAGSRIVAHARDGFTWRASVGLMPTRIETLESGGSAKVNGRTVQGPAYIIRTAELNEISFLSVAADRTTRVQVAAKGATTVDFETWLMERTGLSAATLTAEQRTALEARYRADQAAAAGGNGDGDPPRAPAAPAARASRNSHRATRPAAGARPDPEAGRTSGSPARDPFAAEALEVQRREQVEAVAREYMQLARTTDAVARIRELYDEAIEDATFAPAELRLALERESTRTLAIDNRPRSSGSTVEAAEIEAALAMSIGMKDKSLQAAFSANVLDRARSRWRGGLSLVEVLDFCARANGLDQRFQHSPQEVLAAAMPDPHTRMARASGPRLAGGGGGPSTYDVSGILGNTLNRLVVDYFNSTDMSAMNAIAGTRSVRDFRQVETWALTSDLVFQKVNPGGSLSHGSFNQQGYTNQAETRGRIITIDRTTLMNDDVGAIDRIAQLMGRGGALALLDVFWTAFLNNSAFFTAARGNYDDGTDSALDDDGLTSAKTLFNQLKDPEGKPMNVRPRILLVPPELESTALRLLNSELVVIAGTAGAVTTLGNANIHRGTLTPAMATELSNSAYTGYSAKAWYILADPAIVPTVQIAYVNNARVPTIENAMADFSILGISMRGYFDFGVALQEYRGGVKMKGEA